MQFLMRRQVERLIRRRINLHRKLFEIAPFFDGGGCREQHGRLNFKRFANDVVPSNVLSRWYADARSRARTALEQSLEFESQKRFGYGQETHSQFRGNFAAGNDLAHGQVAAKNTLSHKFVGFGGKARWSCNFSHCNSSHLRAPVVFLLWDFSYANARSMWHILTLI